MKLGIVTPSAPVCGRPQREPNFQQGLENLNSWGFLTHIASHAKENNGYVSSTKASRVADLHEMYRDESIDAILSTGGGWNVNGILNKLDYDLIARNPKPLLGFSDISALQSAIYTQTGITQIQAPMVAVGLENPSELTRTSFLHALNKDTQEFSMQEFGETLVPGTAKGPLFGGNLVTLSYIAGTPYFPKDLEGAIIFIEEVQETIYRLERALDYFNLLGVWRSAAAVIIGTMSEIEETFEGHTLLVDDLLNDYFSSFSIPVIRTKLFGHHFIGKNDETHISLPIGGTTEIDTRSGIKFHYTEDTLS